MKIHYFQRYHQKENVATANTMLLLSRLYSHSTNRFFEFLKENFENFLNEVELEPVFVLQEKNKDSIPDATIKQESFKIIVETKMTDWFNLDQLEKHLNSFGDEKYKILITISSERMNETKLNKFEKLLKEYNCLHNINVMHKNTTFEELIDEISEIIDPRDYEMQDILDDYLDYCYEDKLIPNYDSWKYIRMQLAGATLDFNVSNNLYYDKSERGFRPHDYIGLYKQKSMRAIGKVCARIRAIEKQDGLQFYSDFGELTEERKRLIEFAIQDSEKYDYDLKTVEHRYFFVEKFYETDFRKVSSGSCRGTRIFDLTNLLRVKDIPDTEEIAEILKTLTWE